MLCPFCKSEAFYRYTPNEGKDCLPWYYCSQCAFSGDSFYLYQLYHRLPDTESTVQELHKDGLMNREAINITKDLIGSYESAYFNMRRKAVEWWQASQHNIRDMPNNDHNNLLMKLYMMEGLMQMTKYDRTAYKFVGASGRNDLIKFYGKTKDVQRYRRGWIHFLSLQCCDLPGRATSFITYNGRKDVRFYVSNRLTTQSMEDGFFMRESVPYHVPDVFAFNDWKLALQVQRARMMDDEIPLPVVAWGVNTSNRSWSLLPADRIIMHSNGPNTEIFSQAINCGPRAHIALEPKVSYEDYANDYGVIPYGILPNLKETAQPWPEVLRDHVFSMPVSRAVAFLQQLPINEAEISQLRNSCRTPMERKDMADRLVTLRAKEVTAVINDHRFIEEDDTWYAIGLGAKFSGRQLVFSHPFYMDRILYDPRDKSNHEVLGRMKFKGHTYSFRVPYTELQRNTQETVQDLGMRLTRELPVTGPRAKSQLFEISQRMHPPITDHLQYDVGYDTNTKRFHFPEFTVADGEVQQNELVWTTKHDLPHLPLAGVHLSSIIDTTASTWLRDTPANAALWATMAAVMSNVLAPALGEKTRSIGVVGASWEASLGWRAMKKVAEAWNLPVLTLVPSKHPGPVRGFLDKHKDMAVPSVVSTENSSELAVRTALNQMKNESLIMCVTAEQALLLSMRKTWTFIHAHTMTTALEHIGLHNVLLYLKYFQKMNQHLPAGQSYPHRVLRDMKQWISAMFLTIPPEQVDSLFEKAGKFLATEELNPGATNAEKVLNIAAALATVTGRRRTDLFVKPYRNTGDYRFKQCIVIEDPEAKVAFIHATNFLDAARKVCQYDCDTGEVTALLAQVGKLKNQEVDHDRPKLPGWLVPLSYWQQIVHRYHSWLRNDV